MRSLIMFILFTSCFILPIRAYSETPQQNNSANNAIHHITRNTVKPSVTRPQENSKEDQAQRPTVNRPVTNGTRPISNHVSQSTRPSQNYNRPHQNTRPSQADHKLHSGPHVVATHTRTYYPRPRVRYVRTYYVEPAVVYSSDNSYTVVNDTSESNTASYAHLGKFGFGLNVLFATNSSINDITNYASGGLGLYLKLRPIRYFSLELQNNYIFGALQYDIWDSQSYAKTLFGLGVRLHFFDYGNIDVYAAVAGTISVWSYISEYDYWYDNYTYMNEHGVQYGGQFGGGVSYIAGAIEIGADLRYTIETIPDFVPGYFDYRKNSDVVHGMLLTLNLGFSL